ncbi:MAG TPA: hypothetical protein VNF49_04075 [Candidatus Binataceae bacterium]|nr:hypothetical protein [Candidatus Binataceae bacterium]
MNARWKDREEHPLTADTLEALFDNEIPCIRITGFATPAECRAFVAAMDAVGLKKEYKVAPNVKSMPRYIGVPQFEYRKRAKEEYFAVVAEAYAEQEAVLRLCGFNPLRRLMEHLRRVVPERRVAIAEEPGFGRYYAGIIRDMTGGTNLHLDFARFSAPDYRVGRNDAQIATNFYASCPREGGETWVHNAHFEPPIAPGQYHEISPLDPALVAGAERYAFQPAPGDLVMFNSRNPHRVQFNPNDDGTRRMGIGVFIGRAPERDLLLWS